MSTTPQTLQLALHYQIDILVDLSGHTTHNRVLVFARKPAPVQVTYLGYVNTTGLTTIDYRLVDYFTDPEGVAEPFHSEALLRMPNSYYCYNPIEGTPPVNELPAIHNRYLTFGSFNNYPKMSSETVALWVQLLRTIPNSKLLLKAKSLDDLAIRQSLQEYFTQQGISSERLTLLGYASSTAAHLGTYHQIDIALDSFPYNGATTTCESLWMGVPVVTLVGDTHAARMGLSILSTVGLTELIAHTPAEYLNICINLANNREHLQKLRATMRERMQASPLMDASSFTRQLEVLYRTIWEKWCTK